jgi:hypothetical protein
MDSRAAASSSGRARDRHNMMRTLAIAGLQWRARNDAVKTRCGCTMNLCVTQGLAHRNFPLPEF